MLSSLYYIYIILYCIYIYIYMYIITVYFVHIWPSYVIYIYTIYTKMHSYPKEFLPWTTAETWHPGSPERALGEVPLSHDLRGESGEFDKGFLVRNEKIPSKTQITMKQYVVYHQKYGFYLFLPSKTQISWAKIWMLHLFTIKNLNLISLVSQMCIYQPKWCFHQPKWRFTSQNCLTFF